MPVFVSPVKLYEGAEALLNGASSGNDSPKADDGTTPSPVAVRATTLLTAAEFRSITARWPKASEISIWFGP